MVLDRHPARFRITIVGVEVHRAARRHGISDTDIVRAASDCLISYPLNDDDPASCDSVSTRSGGCLRRWCYCSTVGNSSSTDESPTPVFRPTTVTMKEDPVSGRTPTSNGQPVSEATISRLSDQAERGYDVESLRRSGGRRPMGSAAARVIPVRLNPELEEALRLRAESEHSTSSTVIRDALRAWLKTA